MDLMYSNGGLEYHSIGIYRNMEGVPAGAGLDWVCVPGLHTALAVHLAKDAITPFVCGGVIGDLRTVLALIRIGVGR
jgi:hypothetical protein